MSADNRSVATDALETLGRIIDNTQKRDAIHLAVEPIEAAHLLRPGEPVGIVDGKASTEAEKLLGIVDPFLPNNIKKGEWFWLVVYPRKITSLRHVWSHPDFADAFDITLEENEPAMSSSEAWIREYARDISVPYDMLMEYAGYWVESKRKGEWGEYLNMGPLLEGTYLDQQFWDCYEMIVGEVIEEDRGSFFTCSC